MKKLFASIALFAALALVLAACGTPAQPYTETTITTEPPQQVALHIATIGDAPFYSVYMDTVYADFDGTPEDIVRLLVEHGALPQGTHLLGYTLHGDGTATLDMNEGFMAEQDDATRQQQSASLGATFSAHFGGLTSVYFTAAGESID
ncbi:MAG: GerMN domain-containing protein [Oscillospiraceae bacterium]|nr:GerMN domain-containing protein [Oscillospiraceae bacterium]